jgi:hypothetical protein
MDNLLVCALLLWSRPGSTVVIPHVTWRKRETPLQLDRPEVMESVTRLNPKKYIPIILSQYHILSIELFLEKKRACGGETRFVAILSLHFYEIWIHHDTPMAPFIAPLQATTICSQDAFKPWCNGPWAWRQSKRNLSIQRKQWKDVTSWV